LVKIKRRWSKTTRVQKLLTILLPKRLGSEISTTYQKTLPITLPGARKNAAIRTATPRKKPNSANRITGICTEAWGSKYCRAGLKSRASVRNYRNKKVAVFMYQ